ncbi:RNI-like protein [Polyplosphaeria fusca]|uniref:RNI-like protein n=1 Tax=Polyplosphaeria fusca TaxID=682080 RepID=A0A9P4UUY2_9PLEO|nr:RNI-like protein [Polyplosphaeria fusca]
MEDIHGVDVSWLHHSTRDHHHRQHAPSSPGLARDAPPRTSTHGGLPYFASPTEPKIPEPAPAPAPAVKEVSLPTPPPSTPPASKSSLKRPALLSRVSSEKNGTSPPESKSSLRKNSWISSISSKFSSQNSPAQTSNAQAQGSPAHANGANGTTSSANGALHGIQAASAGYHHAPEPYVPQAPKASFISNALRRLSSGSQVGPTGRVAPQGGVCPRMVLNVDQNRNRCLVPELDQNKLRRVAFCVDVEIAGGPRYKDDADGEEKKKKRKDRKLKERAEGEALKHPDAVREDKDQDGVVKIDSTTQETVGREESPDPEGTVVDEEKKEPSRKKEKKKRSEAERKERKEKKRRRAEENGSIPLELTRDEDDDEGPELSSGTPPAPTIPPKPQGRPTTDPLRIYRRCCQLRETPILKRICDQLSAPQACSLLHPGVVTCLDLTGSRLQLADVVTLSDWLAVVPVKKLFLEDADLNDEKVRVILAGLLAAKIPESPRKRSTQGKDVPHDTNKTEERSGYVKKLVLKNNAKITAEGWKHIALFVYMCKSIQALDVSMINFPKPGPLLSPQLSNTTQSSNGSMSSHSRDVGDILSKAISERLGGSQLEELVMAECSLTSPTIRKLIDGVVISGVTRLSLAGNDIDEEGLDHVLHYIRSGMCQGIDLGGNDIRDFIPRIAQCFTKDCPLWALSLADCDLTAESLKILFPALIALPDFRFLDLSHNRSLSSRETTICLARKYIPQLKNLKRIHLNDINMSPKDAIALADVLPDCPVLAHVNILGNPKITAVSVASDEASQEEAAALYASLMAAAKLSHVLMAIDVDVPGPEASEVVKALAKQIVAYCLRNMEGLSEIPELGAPQKEVEVPDILMHIVGHTEGYSENHDNDPPAPNDDYIVTGTGVVKALSYCLLQKATDHRRSSIQVSGTTTPKSVGIVEDSEKAKGTSMFLLGSARNIKARLQPALVREAREGNDMAYRRLLFLDQTLQGMIQRFEDEYPETRLKPADSSSVHSSAPSTSPPASTVPTVSTATEPAGAESDDDEPKALRSRHNSDVSLASRALSLEEGRLHRLGHRVRTEILNASRPPSMHADQPNPNISGTLDHKGLPEHLQALRDKYFEYSGEEILQMTQSVGIEKAFDTIAENAEEIKALAEENPEEFKRWREVQVAALKNRKPDEWFKRDDGAVNPPHPVDDDKDDFAVED